jgi:DNA/RNA endonuclease YhcR with UshA esterase domain
VVPLPHYRGGGCTPPRSRDAASHPNGVIFSDDANKFPDVDSLDGKTVDITGMVKPYQGRPEIILNDPAQIKAK